MSDAENEIVEWHVIFKGRVQGVGFRYIARDWAEEAGLVGTVRNMPDGSVEMYVQGSVNVIEALLKRLVGPSGPGKILSVEKKSVALQKHVAFQIIH